MSSGKKVDPPGGAVPTRFPDVPPARQFPSGDYSYTLEVVMALQNSVGKLTEAVESLEAQNKGHSDKLEGIGKDVYAAKVIIAIFGGIITIATAFMAVALKGALDYWVQAAGKK